MDLQQVLDRFKADLESYIKEEVARQLAVQTNGVMMSATEPVVSAAPVSSAASTRDVQASLDELSSMITTREQRQNTAADALIEMYGHSADEASSVDSKSVPATSYMDALQTTQRESLRDASNTDALLSMTQSSPDAASEVVLPEPVVTATPEVANTNMSGIQSFLQKIRERKNLSSN